ncbi:hypothetical protein [Nonomuraea turcica]|uniref:hypothetical protein n=1 Tax=Nonomuraea sp. G32 TaxID=3067274 RepID=UPI00273AC247|nr:hypothetical protein [Nonomuraea sp. G32]MDP4501370.1 hypothetical protein [Nonomuraea sp. G32]
MRKQIKETASQAALLAIVATMAGCGTGKSHPDGVTIEGRDPQILVHHRSDRGMEALLTGTLTYNATSTCLAVRNTADSYATVVVWPQGTKPLAKNGKRGVRLPGDAGTLLEGAKVSIGGGYVNWKASTPAGLDVPNDCITDVADATIFEVNPFNPVSGSNR